jgi:hypothetical protein
MNYTERLESIQGELPFDYWLEYDSGASDDEEDGIFYVLIDRLIALGDDGKVEDKIAAFQTLVLALNDLAADAKSLFEPDDCDDILDIIDEIAVAAGLDINIYGEGGSIADQWRKW